MKKILYYLITILSISSLSIAQHNSNQNYDIYESFIITSEIQSDRHIVYNPQPSMPMQLFAQDALVTHQGQGANGNDVSAVTSPGTLYGFGWQQSINNRMADDFVIPNGTTWRIDSIKFYSYQTNSSTTSSITSLNFRILNGRPDNTGSVTLWGDYTTNRLTRTYFSGIYRTSANAPYNNQTTRPIMCVTANMNLIMGPGTYWLDAQCSGSLSSGPWNPPRTILNQAVTGNALQRVSTGWINAVDAGSQKGMPFVVYGTVLTGIVSNTTEAENYSLSQNYPNPFNPTTNINFLIPKSGNVRLSIMNIEGKELDILEDKFLPTGSYTYNFDAAGFSSGVYFYKLVTGEFTETRKMVLIK